MPPLQEKMMLVREEKLSCQDEGSGEGMEQESDTNSPEIEVPPAIAIPYCEELLGELYVLPFI